MIGLDSLQSLGLSWGTSSSAGSGPAVNNGVMHGMVVNDNSRSSAQRTSDSAALIAVVLVLGGAAWYALKK